MWSVRVGRDDAVLVHREQNRAVESVVPGQDLGELRQPFLGPILLVAADKDDMLALTRAVRPLDGEPWVGRAQRLSERSPERPATRRW